MSRQPLVRAGRWDIRATLPCNPEQRKGGTPFRNKWPRRTRFLNHAVKPLSFVALLLSSDHWSRDINQGQAALSLYGQLPITRLNGSINISFQTLFLCLKFIQIDVPKCLSKLYHLFSACDMVLFLSLYSQGTLAHYIDSRFLAKHWFLWRTNQSTWTIST